MRVFVSIVSEIKVHIYIYIYNRSKQSIVTFVAPIYRASIAVIDSQSNACILLSFHNSCAVTVMSTQGYFSYFSRSRYGIEQYSEMKI